MKSCKCYKRIVLLAVILVLVTLMSGCASGKKWWWPWGSKSTSTGTNVDELPPPPDVLNSGKTGDVSSLPMNNNGMPEPDPLRTPASPSADLKDIYFEYDSSDLSSEAKAILDNNVMWLAANPNVTIQIAGHTDARGTVEYNFNLGQRRANSVRDYLLSKNIDPQRMHTISYGEERPIDPAENDAAYKVNRRAQFLVY